MSTTSEMQASFRFDASLSTAVVASGERHATTAPSGPSTAILGSFIQWYTVAQTRSGSTCAALSIGARPRHRSTWSFLNKMSRFHPFGDA